jgi:hypothetical protein
MSLMTTQTAPQSILLKNIFTDVSNGNPNCTTVYFIKKICLLMSLMATQTVPQSILLKNMFTDVSNDNPNCTTIYFIKNYVYWCL